MPNKFHIFFKIFFIAVFLAKSSAATDFTQSDLSSPISDATNYSNVTITNSRTLSSGSITGGYVYFSGTIDGDVNLTNSGSITSTHSNYGVFYFPNFGNTSSIKNFNITNNGSLTTTGDSAIPIYITGKNDGSFPSVVKRSFAFSLNNTDSISSASNAVYITNGNSGTFSITNSGTISSSSSSTGKPITISGGSTAEISNSGTIEASSSSQTAIDVSSSSATIANTGTITGIITTSSSDLDITNNSGTIAGNIVLGK